MISLGVYTSFSLLATYGMKPLTPKELDIYLGTIFPRSFIEATTTLNELFKVPLISVNFQKKEHIYILDVGSGMGGYSLGLVWAIINKFGDKEFTIFSVDGNQEMLKRHQQIISNIQLNIRIVPINKNISPEQFKEDILSLSIYNGTRYGFDIMVASKSIVEIMRSITGKSQSNLYEQFLEATENLVFPIGPGIVIINEVTQSLSGDYVGDLIPKILHPQTIAYQRNPKSKLMCILPVSCAFWYDKCKEPSQCFSQKQMAIKHSGVPFYYRRGDLFNVYYKVFVRKEDYYNIIGDLSKGPEIACVRLFNLDCCNMGIKRNNFKCPSKNKCLDTFSADVYGGVK